MKETKYKIGGRVFVIGDGLVYDSGAASLVPGIVVKRPSSASELSIASVQSVEEGIAKLAQWVSIPVERMPEFAICE